MLFIMAGVCQTLSSILLNIGDSVILNIIYSASYLLAHYVSNMIVGLR